MTVFWPVAEGLGALVSLFAWLGAALILFAYRSTIGALITLLAGALQDLNFSVLGVSVPLGSILSGPIVGLNSAVERVLGTAVSATQYSWHYWMHALSGSITWIGQAVDYDMHEVGKAFGALRRATIPRLISQSIAAAEHPIRFAQAQLTADLAAAERSIGSDLLATQRAVAAAERAAEERLGKLEAGVKGAAASAIAVTLPQIHGLEHDLSGVEAWIKAHAKDFTVAGITGAVLAVVTSEFSFLRCNNTKSFLRHLCGLPIKLFEDLLGGVLDYLVISNLCYLLTEMEKLSLKMLPYIEDGTSAIDSIIGCQKSTVAAAIPLNYTSVPVSWANLTL